ncbi:hypothetical protein [Mucilaginibacter sp. UR6-11]|uniref:hypothetical protein n=1 Tax=Mucilaginibacter sp. UR6-11 TaxID=1435644 RepID=UPI001E601AB9|nr:hypothetical protein [Mucilaginibacter sp. UR6-11]MCC8427161.1 hypothetical protein [Mucilaginibacter sp. UR6-11]
MQPDSYGGAFPVRPGSLVLSPSVNYFFANKGWDSLRKRNPFAAGGRFQSVSYSLYTEYGISKRFAVVGTLPFVMNNYRDNSGYNSQTNGLTDLEVGLKCYVANINYIYYFSVQGTFIMPLYTNNVNLGYGEKGAELKASFGGSGHVLGKNYYFTIENGLRQYFGTAGPLQDRYTATFGLTLDKKFKHQLSFSAGGFYSTSSLSSTYDPAHIASNKNFAFNQVSLSYGYAFSKRLSLFLSAGTFINGRNTGDGSSASASLIIRPF